MDALDNVLVAIMNNQLDFMIAQHQGWYRIPTDSVRRLLTRYWPPVWIAFYHTKVFVAERYTIAYYAKVNQIRLVTRASLFPDQPTDRRSQTQYYQLFLGPLQALPTPIVSPRLRRITFIPTTGQKFLTATEINDLFNDSPLEDLLWDALKKHHIPADRQDLVHTPSGRIYIPDFIVPCVQSKLVIEADGDMWHANPRRAGQDNIRDNAFKAMGWQLIRFNGTQIRDHMTSYCLPTIESVCNRLGGLDEGSGPRHLNLRAPSGTYQMSLFDAHTG